MGHRNTTKASKSVKVWLATLPLIDAIRQLKAQERKVLPSRQEVIHELALAETNHG